MNKLMEVSREHAVSQLCRGCEKSEQKKIDGKETKKEMVLFCEVPRLLASF